MPPSAFLTLQSENSSSEGDHNSANDSPRQPSAQQAEMDPSENCPPEQFQSTARDEANNLKAWLQGHRLEAYHGAMVENGFDSIQDLFHMSAAELEGMFELLSIKPGHVLRFRRAVQSGMESGEAKVAQSRRSPDDEGGVASRSQTAAGIGVGQSQTGTASQPAQADSNDMQQEAAGKGKFCVGQEVEVCWGGEWFEAEVRGVDQSGYYYTVFFPIDNTEGSNVTEAMMRDASKSTRAPAASQNPGVASAATQGAKKNKKKKNKKSSADETDEKRNEEAWTVVQGLGRRSPAAPAVAAEPPARNSPAAPAAAKNPPARAAAKQSSAPAPPRATAAGAAPRAAAVAAAGNPGRDPALSRTVDVLRLLPDGRLAASKVPKGLLTVSGTYSVADCAAQLAKQLQFGHFGVPGVDPRTRVAERGAGVMVLQMRSSPQTYLMSVTPCPGLPAIPLNALATGLLLKKDMRCYGSALVLSYAFAGYGPEGPLQTYSPLAEGDFCAIPGVKEALEQAKKDRAFEDSYKAQPLSASTAAAAQEGQKKWGFSSFGTYMSQTTDPLHDLLNSKLSEAEAKAKKAAEQAKKAEDDARSAKEAATKAQEDAKKAQQAPDTVVPPYWSGQGSGRMQTHFMKQIVQQVLLTSSIHHSADLQCRRLQEAAVLKVERVENPVLWTGYQQCKQRLLIGYAKRKANAADLNPPIPEVLRDLDPSKHLDPRVNEVYLFHGTTKEKADAIAQQGFDARVASTGLYGHGVYFAHEACKALQYAMLRVGDGAVVIVSRVILGDPFYITGSNTSLKRPPERNGGTHELWDSVVANPGIPSSAPMGKQVHREYIVYEQYQAYPEFIATLK